MPLFLSNQLQLRALSSPILTLCVLAIHVFIAGGLVKGINRLISSASEKSKKRKVHKLLRFYRLVFNALVEGLESSPRRRAALPPELALRIMRYAHFIHPRPSLLPTDLKNLTGSTLSPSGKTTRVIWYRTPPFTRQMLDRIAEMELLMRVPRRGRDSNSDPGSDPGERGWCNDAVRGGWSWGNVSLVRTTTAVIQTFQFSPSDLAMAIASSGSLSAPLTRDTLSRLGCSSGFSVTPGDKEWESALRFGVGSWIWGSLKVEDAVQVCLGAWSSMGESEQGTPGVFQVWEFWDPSREDDEVN